MTFAGCANLEVVVDADVLDGNAPSNTASVSASVDRKEIEALMRRQKLAWNVRYDRPIDPMPVKLASIDTLVCFHMRLFGGHLLVIARSFSLEEIA